MQADHDQSRGRPLEDRLRNLILTRSDLEAVPAPASPNPATFTSVLPPESNFQPGKEVRDEQTNRNGARATSKGGRKRPNQAQRRQMNAELSIPIDTRAPSRSPLQQYTRPQSHGDAQPLRHAHQQNPLSSASPARPQNWAASNNRQSYGQAQQAHAQLPSSSLHRSDWRRQRNPNVNGLFRGVNIVSADDFPSRSGHHPHQTQPTLYNPGAHRQALFTPEQLANQSAFLDRICHQIVMGAEIGPDEIAEKEKFRRHVEAICRHVVACHEFEANGIREFQPETIELKCFGSLASGFATKAADMDLGLLSPMSRLSPDSPESPIPRLIEGALLSAGFGARLLTKTRVPIIKLCENPDAALRQNLLGARIKWENGVEEEREPEEDIPEDLDLLPNADSPKDTSPKQNPTRTQAPQQLSSIQDVSSHDKELSSLRQSSNQSLASYYNNAKRLLRRLNGRDITHSNYQDFTEANFTLLDNVGKAFANGLHDSDLRDRILAYPSFHIGDVTQLTNYRSLFGVNMMIEGEKLVLSWETRQFSPESPKADHTYEKAIQQWKDLQYNKNFGTTPIWFNKELQLAVEALRQIPSIQVMHLQQEQHESPMQYHNRTNKIALSFPETIALSGVGIRSHIIKHYIDGVRDEGIRNKLHDFVALTRTQSLRTIARVHKSLHLAADYERAIEQGRYRPEDVPTLQSYIAILRRKPIPSAQRPADFEYVIPIIQNDGNILDSIRQLPDPATLSPNKPRDRYSDSLEFPKSGVGVQCDINFSAHLGLQNTLLLRCYSYTDPRVRPLVLFVKHWAKARGINTPYRGTLSSYGYVLMVLHYLVNIVEPFVCPNLQELAPPDPDLPPQALEGITTCQGRNVRFWRDERAIQSLAQHGQLNQNRDSIGSLLRGFFEYYAQGNMVVALPKRGFDWGRDVISLRTHGGLLSKGDKGWTGARTVIQPQGGAPPASAEPNVATTQPLPPNNKIAMPPKDGKTQPVTEQQAPKSKDVKEIRHRFLFAIEDPFELDHNVARTVTHGGIVAIRDEFRRAWRIIKAAGKGHVTEDLLEDTKAHKEQVERKQFVSLLDEIHGNEVFPDQM
ncbi:hypothetical protein O1611_g4368 [Lasiodiplodia mahajangana]|uniref:Uncharacterized protein n=1 Tax=Lasiodiplodia mahajangana TaxID=1108764 RepID=A0ACC2JPY1_9PEZI|nr:hypothetical protein O1611_g4368 [Lasiodiplodia mahajangana]